MRRAKFMMIGLQITATIMGVTMVKSAMKYERALRNVTSLMAGAGMGQEQIEKNFKRMDSMIRRLAVELGQAPADLAAGMYNVVSATFQGGRAGGRGPWRGGRRDRCGRLRRRVQWTGGLTPMRARDC